MNTKMVNRTPDLSFRPEAIAPKAVAPDATQPKPISAIRAAALQLAPGLASLPVFAVSAALLAEKEIPSMFALGLTVLLVEVPISWLLMFRQLRYETGKPFSIASAFPWRAALRWWHYLLIGIPVMVFSMMVVAFVEPFLASVLLSSVFSWVPDWFVLQPDPAIFTKLSPALLLALWGMVGVSMVLVGGVTQELFSRGFLLPRTAHLGFRAPVYNAMLFSVFHLIAPWSWAGFFLMTLPWALLVCWTRSVKLGLFIHIGMLTVQWMGLTLMVFGLAPNPPAAL